MAKTIGELVSSPTFRRPCSDCGEPIIGTLSYNRVRCDQCKEKLTERRLKAFWAERDRRKKKKPQRN